MRAIVDSLGLLHNCEYTSGKAIIIIKVIITILTLLQIIDRYFCNFIFDVFYTKKTPRNFIDSVRVISLLFIFSFGRVSGKSTFLLGLEKRAFCFFTLSESLLETNHFRNTLFIFTF